MAFMDLFRPKWKSSNPAIRQVAVAALQEPALLATVATTDEHPDVRLEAVAFLAGPASGAGAAEPFRSFNQFDMDQLAQERLF